MKNLGWIFVFILSVNCILFAQNISDENSTELKIDKIISQLTLEEKIALLGGTGFATKPIERLGIPEIRMADGPVGVRWDKSTAFPVSIAMAATWNVDLINSIGKGLAGETLAKGRNMLLGPCINIVRVPHGGRNFESFGEDPYLTSRLAVSYIKGLEENGVIASVKHFAVNNQEYERMTISAEVDERTLREIYLPGFEAAVKEGNVSTVMAAYNRLNGTYCAEHDFLLNKILKDEWGFKGFVVSDWGAVHSTIGTAKFGVDLEMPFGKYLNNSLIDLITNGDVDIKIIDDKVRRLLRVMLKFNLFENPQPEFDKNIYEKNKIIAYKTATESIVLLKNENDILPLNTDLYNKIAVIGPNAKVNVSGGGGSSKVNPVYSISPFDALQNKIKNADKIIYAQGCRNEGQIDIMTEEFLKTVIDGKVVSGFKGEYFKNKELKGEPALIRIDKTVDFNWSSGGPDSLIGEDNFSIRWTGKLIAPKSGKVKLGTISDDGVKLYFNGELKIDNWTDHAALFDGFTTVLEEGKEYDIKIEFYENGGDAVLQFGYESLEDTLLAEAVNTAKESDIALLFLGNSEYLESEGFDRTSLELPENQLALLNAVLSVNKNVIVVLNNGGQILMSEWIDKVQGLVEAWFPGQEGGNAVADVLLGNVNPSGKLPHTIAKKLDDYSAYKYYPGSDGKISYADGLFVGYRYFDNNKIEPQFHFGYGLTYTSFKIEDVKVANDDSKIKVSLNITNTGNLEGSEVIQVYVSDKTNKIIRPVKELKKFLKVLVKPGETKNVNLDLSTNDLKYYCIEKSQWTFEPGEYEILVGNSSNEKDLIFSSITVN